MPAILHVGNAVRVAALRAHADDARLLRSPPTRYQAPNPPTAPWWD